MYRENLAEELDNRFTEHSEHSGGLCVCVGGGATALSGGSRCLCPVRDAFESGYSSRAVRGIGEVAQASHVLPPISL